MSQTNEKAFGTYVEEILLTRTMIERLQKYCPALITTAVTDKIDVRGSVATRHGKPVASASP